MNRSLLSFDGRKQVSTVGAAIHCAQGWEWGNVPTTNRVALWFPPQPHRGRNELLPLPKCMPYLIVKVHHGSVYPTTYPNGVRCPTAHGGLV